MKRLVTTLLAFALLVPGGLVACGGSQQHSTARRRRSSPQTASNEHTDDHGRCDTSGANAEVSEYDTSGDHQPDVRRVFRRMGEAPLFHLVLVCREADLNADGTKDVVRFYNDEGRPLREEADRDFDGQIDTITYFQDGRVVRQELDENGDGRVDLKIFFDESGVALRSERDLAGRSTATEWHPDRWEYFEEGRMVRMGTDIDGDGRVDRWDRNHDLSPAPGEGGAESGNGADSAAPSPSP